MVVYGILPGPAWLLGICLYLLQAVPEMHCVLKWVRGDNNYYKPSWVSKLAACSFALHDSVCLSLMDSRREISFFAFKASIIMIIMLIYSKYLKLSFLTSCSFQVKCAQLH